MANSDYNEEQLNQIKSLIASLNQQGKNKAEIQMAINELKASFSNDVAETGAPVTSGTNQASDMESSSEDGSLGLPEIPKRIGDEINDVSLKEIRKNTKENKKPTREEKMTAKFNPKGLGYEDLKIEVDKKYKTKGSTPSGLLKELKRLENGVQANISEDLLFEDIANIPQTTYNKDKAKLYFNLEGIERTARDVLIDNDDVKKYLGEEKYKQFIDSGGSIPEKGIGIGGSFDYGDEEIVGFSVDNQNQLNDLAEPSKFNTIKLTQQRFLRTVPKDVRDKMNVYGEGERFKSAKAQEDYLKFTGNFVTEENERINALNESYNKETIKYSKGFDNIQSAVTNILQNSPDGNINLATPEQQTNYNELIAKNNSLVEQYALSGFEEKYKQLNTANTKNNALREDFLDVYDKYGSTSLLEKNLTLDYGLGARVAMNMEEFFVRDIAKNFSSLAQSAYLNTVKALTLEEGKPEVQAMIDAIKQSTVDYNKKIAKKREDTLPENLTLDDTGKKGAGYFRYFTETLANNSATIATTFIPGGLAFKGARGVAAARANIARLNSGGQASKRMASLYGQKAMDLAIAKQKTFGILGMRAAQGIFFTGESGGKFGQIELTEANALEQLPKLRLKLDGGIDDNGNTVLPVTDPIVRADLEDEIEELNDVSNYSLNQKAFTSFAYGGIATAAETLGTLSFITGARSLASGMGKQSFKLATYAEKIPFAGNVAKKAIIGLTPIVTKAAPVELLEETLTMVGHNLMDITVLDEDKSLIDGLDKDFFANTLITTLAIFSPKMSGNFNNMLKNEYRTEGEVMENQKRIKELVTLQDGFKDLKGSQLTAARKRRKVLIKELALDDVMSIQKLTKLTSEEIFEAADYSRQMRLMAKEAQRMGAENDLSESGKIDKSSLIKQYKAIAAARSKLLNSSKVIAFEQGNKQRKIYGDLATNPELNYDIGLYNMYKDVAATLMPKNGNFINIENYSDSKDGSLDLFNSQIALYSKEDQEAIRNSFSRGSNAIQIGKDIILNEPRILEQISKSLDDQGGRYSAVAPLEELFHLYNKNNNVVKNGKLTKPAEAAVDEAITILKNKRELNQFKNKSDYDDLIERFELYKQGGRGKVIKQDGTRGKAKVDAEEIIAQINNAVALGVLNVSDISSMPDFKGFVNTLSAGLLGDASWMFKLESGYDVFRFVKNFQGTVESKTAVDSSPEEDNIIKESLAGFAAEIDTFAPKQGQTIDSYRNDPNYYSLFQAIGNVENETTRIKGFQNQTLDAKFVKAINNVASIVTKGKLERDLDIQAIRDNLSFRFLKNYDPVKNPSVFGWMTSGAVSPLRGAVLDQIKAFKSTPTDQSSSFDIEQGQVGAVQEMASTDADFTENIDQEIDAPQSQIKQEAPELIDQTIEEDIETAVLEIAEGVFPDIQSQEFLPFIKEVIAGKLTNKFKNKFGTRKQYDNFINKIVPALKSVMPVSYFKQIESDLKPKDRQFTEPPVRLTTQEDIDKARNNEQINYLENDAQGVNLYKLKKFSDKELADFFNPPSINPDTGKISNTKGNRKTALATAVATQSAFDMIPSIFKSKVGDFELSKIGEKIRRDPTAKFSKTTSQNEINAFMMNEMLKTSDDFATNNKNISLIGDKLGITNQFDMATDDGRKAWRDWVTTITNKKGQIVLPKEVIQTLMGSSESVGNLDLPGAIPGTITDDNTTSKAKEPVEIRDYTRNLPFLNNDDFNKWAEGKSFVKLDNVWKDMLFKIKPKGKKYKGEDIFKSKAFNKSQDNSIEGLKRLAYIFQDLMSTKKVIDEKNGKEITVNGLETNGAGILAMMATTSANQNQMIRRAAPWRFFEKGFLTEEMVEEHTLPASIVSKYILIQAALGKLDNSWQNLERNFFQGALLKKSDDMLAGEGVNGKKFSYKSKTPEGWLLTDNIWARYFNINVASNNLGGISPNQIVQFNGETVFEQYGVNSAGYKISKTIQKQSNQAAIKNNGLLPKKVKLVKNSSNPEVLNKMASLDNEAFNARIKESKNKPLNQEFNEIIERATGIGREKQYGKTKARAVGAGKGKFDLLGIPPSAQDFVGLTRYFAGKGKKGDETIAWVKENFLDPFARGNIDISNARVALGNDFKNLKKLLGIGPKNLNKKITGEPYTVGNAIRVFTWTQQGMKVPGLSKADAKILNDYVLADENLQLFASELIAINKDNGYPKPGDGWLAGTITTDLLSGLNTVVRAKYLKQWQNNVNEVFTEENMNKLEASFGKGYRDSLENMLGRMKTGSNRGFKGDTLTGRFTDWINGAVGAIMFFNMRSAVLQTISAVNFINFTDNNPLKAAAAFANQPQYWKDVVELMNSDYLIERRNGLKINVSEADIAEIAAESKNKAKAFISKILKLGFLPTQIADSFAIASGGATFYRNRLKSLKKQGLSNAEAEAQAFQDFRETAEESQQSSRPDRISKQQAGPLGRIILAFANTPAQYARIMQKAASDLKNRRGDDKTNMSKIMYYGFIQNVIFNALQQALFAMAFADEEPDEEKKNKKYIGIMNGMADSLLRGVGFHGAAISTLKNVIMKLANGAKAQDAAIEMLDISPPISSKIGKLKSAGRTWDWNKKEIMEKGWSLDNPAWLASGQVISAATNIPLDRGIRKLQNLKDASDAENEEWMRVANALGWQKWELDWTKPKKKSFSTKINNKINTSINTKL